MLRSRFLVKVNVDEKNLAEIAWFNAIYFTLSLSEGFEDPAVEEGKDSRFGRKGASRISHG